MDQPDRAVLLRHGAQDRIGDGVVAAERQRNAVLGENAVIGVGDDVHAFRQVERVDRHVADVGDLQAVEGCGARRHVVGPDEAGFGPDLARPEARAGAVRCADVHRHADEAGVEPLGRGLSRQPHEGRRRAEARHLVAAERLVEFRRHVTLSKTISRPVRDRRGDCRKARAKKQSPACSGLLALRRGSASSWSRECAPRPARPTRCGRDRRTAASSRTPGAPDRNWRPRQPRRPAGGR